ncbi:sugar O-acetyltransferase [Thaumasiovibrio subtropicus]|uniref:sugar O-acetyltransferase n=1 Tax=Thaumasiovibrio subtropicus TaxID=1891207 RepID=UPI000B35AE44|nr:sugar O-acetyltransferase [Thaumasiovibrio subtropicus]
MARTKFDIMTSGELYWDEDETITDVRDKAAALVTALNQSLDMDSRMTILHQLLGAFGSQSKLRSPFTCEFGKNIFIGKNTLVNMNAMFLDCARIVIGDNVLIGPNAQFYTASHPLDYQQRRRWETYCEPILIEDDVWIGGGVVIKPGVTIGARSVVAAGSFVNRDVPPDTLYGGVPARFIKHLVV